jgi:hypothetical protein
MPIVIEEVTGEIAPRGGSEETSTPAPAPAPDTQSDLREHLLCELALIRERQARLFAD